MVHGLKLISEINNTTNFQKDEEWDPELDENEPPKPTNFFIL